MMRALILAAMLACFAQAAHAQQAVVLYCVTGTSSTGVPIAQPATAANPCPVTGGTAGAAIYTKPAQFTPLGYSQYSLSSTAQTVATMAGGSIPAGAIYAFVAMTGNAANYRDDGAAPTATVGQPLAVGQSLLLSETNLGSVQFIAQAGTATVNILFAK